MNIPPTEWTTETRHAWQEALAALPDLGLEAPLIADDASRPLTPLDVATRQGRLFLRQTASLEAQTAQLRELSEQLKTRDRNLEEAQDAARHAERRARDTALAALHLMDALGWAQNALVENGMEAMAREMASAQRDCVRRLAAVGVTEVPADGLMDGRLHEGLEAEETDASPRYHIVRVVRRGWQQGSDVLRRAGVVTAA